MGFRLLSVFVAAGAVSAACATAASAQSESEFIAAFSGEWRVHDEAFAQGVQICRITLRGEAEAGRYKLDRTTCGGELAGVSSWGIADGQMALFAGEGVVVTLGGTQRRMSGATKSGAPVIIEKANISGIAEQLQAAHRASGCYYLGFTDRCAAEADLAKPAAAGAGQPARVNVIVNLNTRAEARDDAGVIGVVPANSCVAINACVTASDGVWCQAEFGDRVGWLRKLAIRQDRWPVVTFVNQCQE